MGGRKIVFMSENINNKVILEEEKTSFDFRQLWKLLILNWYWIIISMVTCVLLAGLYLWFTPTTITVSNKMKLLGNSNQSSAANAKAAVLNSLPMGLGNSLGGGSVELETEKEILKSRSLIRDVVNDLGIHTEYHMGSFLRKDVIYKYEPLDVTLDPAHMQWLDEELISTYHQIDMKIEKFSEGYKVVTTLKMDDNETVLPVQTFKTIPATIKTDYGSLTITDNSQLTSEQREWYSNGYTMYATIFPPMTMAKMIASRLSIETPGKRAINMFNITVRDENKLRAIDILNHLVEHYNQRANDEKNEEARKTDEFVNTRLAKIDAELGSSDAAWENSKKNFQITSPEVDAAEVMGKKSVYESQLVAIGTELQLHDYLSEYVNNPANLFEIIPSAMSSGAGVGSDASTAAASGGASGTSSLLAQHNALVNQRRDLLKSVSEMSPQVQRITQSIQELHPVLQTALKRDRQQILMRQNTLQREYGKYMGRVSSAPQQERVLTEIGRQREIKQGVYLVMLQKREEAAMELTKSTTKGKLIDETMISGAGEPQKKSVLLIAVFLGAILPMLILFLQQLFKSTVDTCSELKKITRFPVVGEIPLIDNDDAIRTLRTNIIQTIKEGNKTILVVSDGDGDGRTFIAQRLTESLNAIGKNTILIDGDLRKTNLGGHPADILASESFAQQVAKAKADSDYVVFDSSSMSKYSDVYQLAPFADNTLFIVKAGSTNKSVVEALNGDTKLPNIMLALNAIDTTSKKYKLNKK